MKIFIRLLILTFLFGFVSAYAQNTIQGVVADSLSKEALVGASVSIIGSARGSATDVNGEYRITNIPDGTYRIRASYIGYAQKILNVSVRGGQTLDLFIQMSAEIIEGKVITITAQALGQAAAINQ